MPVIPTGVIKFNGGGGGSGYTPPTGMMVFKGAWNADTNTPDITTAPKTGDTYVVDVAGTTTVGGHSVWDVGDFLVYDGGNWQRIVNLADLDLAALKRLYVSQNANPSLATGSIINPYATITDALTGATFGDDIEVQTGQYNGNITLPSVNNLGLSGRAYGGAGALSTSTVIGANEVSITASGLTRIRMQKLQIGTSGYDGNITFGATDGRHYIDRCSILGVVTLEGIQRWHEFHGCYFGSGTDAIIGPNTSVVVKNVPASASIVFYDCVFDGGVHIGLLGEAQNPSLSVGFFNCRFRNKNAYISHEFGALSINRCTFYSEATTPSSEPCILSQAASDPILVDHSASTSTNVANFGQRLVFSKSGGAAYYCVQSEIDVVGSGGGTPSGTNLRP